ncbi:MAG: DUF6672 family protein [Oscillospiraceae bacterium]
MNKKRAILFRVGAVVLLLIIGAIMMVIGRGHTVYLDSKTLEYNGQTYTAPYKVTVTVGGEQVAKLYDKERGMATCIGQKLRATLEITQEKGGAEETREIALPLPYAMDGIAINLPGYLAGLPEEAYLSVFQIQVEETEEAEDVPVDDFALPAETDIAVPAA